MLSFKNRSLSLFLQLRYFFDGVDFDKKGDK